MGAALVPRDEPERSKEGGSAGQPFCVRLQREESVESRRGSPSSGARGLP